MIPQPESRSIRSLILWIFAAISISALHPAIVHAQATTETSVKQDGNSSAAGTLPAGAAGQQRLGHHRQESRSLTTLLPARSSCIPKAGMTSRRIADKDDKNRTAEASMFYVAYFKSGDQSAQRPITFFYNGGPGSSTVWLHMGAFGPKRVVTARRLPYAGGTLFHRQ